MEVRGSVPLMWLALGGVFIACVPVPAEGQATTGDRGVVITGTVSDQISGEALPSAQILIGPVDEDEDEEAVAWEGETNEFGAFRTERLEIGVYRIRIRSVGFTAASQVGIFLEDGTVELTAELAPQAMELEGIVVTVTRQSRLENAGFYDRRQSGFGYSFTREEIEARRPGRVSDLFRSVPGARVIFRGGLLSPDVRLRGGCVPDVVLDGLPIATPARVDEVLTVHELEALEVYSGATSPMQYSRSSCGTILAWTRPPAPTEGAQFSWRRLFAAAGFAAVAVFATR